MRRHLRIVLIGSLLLATPGMGFARGPGVGTATAQAPALKIIVIAGEAAVNIIQQKTAVNPIVEVRDRNDLPVAGVVVTFTLEAGPQAAFSSGLQSLTVTTNAAGRAAVTGLNPVGSGAYQINVSAVHQGQAATATISQTNVATAPGVAAAGGVVAAAGATAVASAGGGLSGVVIGALAAAGGGGAILAAKAAGGSSESPPPVGSNPPPPPPPPPPTPTTYTGPVEARYVFTQITTPTMGPTTMCMHTRAISGTVTMRLEQRADGTVAGTADTDGTVTEVDYTVSPVCSPIQSTPFNRAGPVSGTAGNLAFRSESTVTGTSPDGGTSTVTTTLTFSGALTAGVISGTLTYSVVGTGQQGPPFSGQISSSGSTTFPVMLR